MKNLEIQVNSKNNQILKSSDILGISSENLQGKIIFKPVPFVDGACRLYIENKGTILMEKEEDCYTLDILSSLLTEPSLDICFKITEPQNEKGTPVFCSKIIHLKVLDTIDSDEEIPDQYPTWIEILDSKIAELEALEEDVEEAEEERNQAVQEAIGNIQDMTEAYNQNAVAKTNAFNTNATNKTNAFDNHVSNKEAEFDTDTDAIVSTKKAELDEYEESKENELDTYTNSLKNDLDVYETAKETELNSHTGEKKTELDTYEGVKETELNTYANGLKSDFDTNATNKTTAFDTNATNKTNDFNTNAINKTTEYDNNATTKTTTFNENATEKTGNFNDNVDEKTAEFDTHVTEKEVEFDENVDNIQEQITDIQEFIDSEMDKVTTEKSTRIDVTNAAKWYSQLPPAGRTTQKQLSGKNKLEFPYYNNNYSDSIGRIVLNETYENNFSFILERNLELPAGKYILTFNDRDENLPSTCYAILKNITDDVDISNYIRKKCTFTINDTKTIRLSLVIIKGTYDNVIIEPMLRDFTISDGSFEPYCGGQPSPNPDYPQPIENIEGRSCRNLFSGDFSQFDSVGGEGSTYAYFKLPDDTKQYTLTLIAKNDFTPTRYTYIGFTKNGGDGNGNYKWAVSGSMSTITKGTVISIESTSNLRFLSLFDKKEDTLKLFMDNFDIQLDEGFTSYEPYFEGKRLEINVCNKNLAKALRLGYYVGATGVYVADTTHTCSSEPIKIRNGATYKYSIDGVGVEGYAYEYDENDNYLGRKYFSASSAYTPTNGATYFNYAFKDSTLANVPLNSKVQIEEGTATPYEEHKEQMIPFQLQEGQKLMEGDYLAEDGIHHVRGQVVLDGTENISLSESGEVMRFSYTINDMKKANNGTGLSTHFTNSNYVYTAGRVRFGWSNNVVFFYCDGTQFTSVEDFKTWLAEQYADGTPVIIEYDLATETIDTYTPAQAEAYSKLMKLMLYKGVNHIWTETDGLEPNLKLTYYKSNKLRLDSIEARLELLEE